MESNKENRKRNVTIIFKYHLANIIKILLKYIVL